MVIWMFSSDTPVIIANVACSAHKYRYSRWLSFTGRYLPTYLLTMIISSVLWIRIRMDPELFLDLELLFRVWILQKMKEQIKKYLILNFRSVPDSC